MKSLECREVREKEFRDRKSLGGNFFKKIFASKFKIHTCDLSIPILYKMLWSKRNHFRNSLPRQKLLFLIIMIHSNLPCLHQKIKKSCYSKSFQEACKALFEGQRVEVFQLEGWGSTPTRYKNSKIKKKKKQIIVWRKKRKLNRTNKKFNKIPNYISTDTYPSLPPST